MEAPGMGPIQGGEGPKLPKLIKEYKGPEHEKTGRIRAALSRALSFITQPVTAKLVQKYERLEKELRTNPSNSEKLERTMDRLEKLPGVKKTVQANAVKQEIAVKKKEIEGFREKIKGLSDHIKTMNPAVDKAMLDKRVLTLANEYKELDHTKMELILRGELAEAKHEENRAEFNRLKAENERIENAILQLPFNPTTESRADHDQLVAQQIELNDAVVALKANGRAVMAEMEEVKKLKEELELKYDEKRAALSSKHESLDSALLDFELKTAPLHEYRDDLKEKLAAAEAEAEEQLKQLEGTPLYQDALSWYTDISNAQQELKHVDKQIQSFETPPVNIE